MLVRILCVRVHQFSRLPSSSNGDGEFAHCLAWPRWRRGDRILGSRALGRVWCAELPRTDQIELDRLVLGFSALIAVTATLGFGLWPALRASRLDLVRSLKGKTVGLVSTRLVGRLVEVEVAIAFVLLSASSLLVRSLIATESIELGFVPRT